MRQADDKSTDEPISPDEIEGIPADSICKECGIGWMIRSNQSACQKKLGEFTWYFQATCDNCGHTKRDHRRYIGRIRPNKQKRNPQPDLF